jgi:hypothetical protein
MGMDAVCELAAGQRQRAAGTPQDLKTAMRYAIDEQTPAEFPEVAS